MIRCSLAWVLYWIGDAFSRPLFWFGDTWANAILVDLCWRPYQKFMDWSDRMQGDSDNGPWSTPKPWKLSP